MRRKIFAIGLLGWVALAVFSLTRYYAIFHARCYFQSSWIFCSEQLSRPLQLISFLLVAGSVGCVVFAGRLLYNAWRCDEELPTTVLKWAWLYLVLAILVVPFGSGDVSYYFSAGKAVAHGLNPYVDAWTLNRWFVSVNHVELLTGFSYGPIIAAVFRGMYGVSGQNPAWFVVFWKIFVAIALVMTGWVSLIIMKKLGIKKNVATWWVFWLLQPLLLFECLVNGHFDVVWVLCLLLAVLAALHRRWWLVLPLISIGIWIKFIPLLTIPFFVLWWWQETHKKNWLKQVAQAVLGLLISVIITVVAWLPFWRGFRVFDSIILQSKWAVSSLFAIVYYSLQPLFVWLLREQAHFVLTRVVQGSIFMLLIYMLWPYIKMSIRIVLKKQALTDVGFIQFMCVSLLCYLGLWQKSFWPWYPAWILPLGVIIFEKTKNMLWGKLWTWLGTAPLVWYVLWLPVWLTRHADAAGDLWFWWVFVSIVWAYPLYILLQLRKDNYNIEVL